MAKGLGQVALAGASSTGDGEIGRLIDKAARGEFLDKGLIEKVEPLRRSQIGGIKPTTKWLQIGDQ
ncbi:hypothetical protein [Desulfurivibrio sp. C05AmB]|uniref:hypothetical protein n=1 Tax=Desulfurivibrio sp. C05AmB TaxID=3374371 RepID=UPI00376F372D